MTAKKRAPKKRQPAAPKELAIRDRIKELRRVPVSQLIANDKNWRTHPETQQAALQGVLSQIGYADALIAYERDTGELVLIDGHLRKDITPNAIVPVLVLDVSEAEADVLLATLDPLAMMAAANKSKLDSLLRDVHTGSEAVDKMLTELAQQHALIPVMDLPEPPESVQENVEQLNDFKRQRREGKQKVQEKTDTEKYLVIVFPTRAAKEEALQKLGLPADERYLAAESVEVRARGQLKPLNEVGKAAPMNKAGATG